MITVTDKKELKQALKERVNEFIVTNALIKKLKRRFRLEKYAERMGMTVMVIGVILTPFYLQTGLISIFLGLYLIPLFYAYIFLGTTIEVLRIFEGSIKISDFLKSYQHKINEDGSIRFTHISQ